MKRTLLALLAASLVAAPALAQTAPARDGRYVQHPTILKIEDGTTVDGNTSGPSGSVVSSRRAQRRDSIITVRQDFQRELLKSAEDL